MIDHFVLPHNIDALVKELSQRGLGLTLVGGAVRDFLHRGHLSRDLDFEVRCLDEEKSWPHFMQELKDLLSERYTVQLSPKFYVLKISLDDCELELAPARVEEFSDQSEHLGHRDVDISFVRQISYAESFRRRDFTCNAMGIEMTLQDDEWDFHFVDPYKGFEHMKQKLLCHCSDDFYRDPVRFLRALRFSLALDCELSPELLKQMGKMSLQSLSLHYFFYEAFKGSLFLFCDHFFSMIDRYGVMINERLEHCRLLQGYSSSQEEINNLEDAVFFLAREGIEREKLMSFAQAVQIKKSIVKKALKTN